MCLVLVEGVIKKQAPAKDQAVAGSQIMQGGMMWTGVVALTIEEQQRQQYQQFRR
jgi:hypothetical protein